MELVVEQVENFAGIVLQHPDAPLTDFQFLDGRGEAFDSSAGFFPASGALRSPDSAWVSHGGH